MIDVRRLSGLRLKRPDQSAYATALQVLTVNPYFNQHYVWDLVGPCNVGKLANMRYVHGTVDFDFRPSRHCPICARGLYHHAIYEFKALHSCPIHGVSLLDKCPSCKKPWPNVWEFLEGHCPGCTCKYHPASEHKALMPVKHPGYEHLETLRHWLDSVELNIGLVPIDYVSKTITQPPWPSEDSEICTYPDHPPHLSMAPKIADLPAETQAIIDISPSPKLERRVRLIATDSELEFRYDEELKHGHLLGLERNLLSKELNLRNVSNWFYRSLRIDYQVYIAVLRKLREAFPKHQYYEIPDMHWFSAYHLPTEPEKGLKRSRLQMTSTKAQACGTCIPCRALAFWLIRLNEKYLGRYLPFSSRSNTSYWPGAFQGNQFIIKTASGFFKVKESDLFRFQLDMEKQEFVRALAEARVREADNQKSVANRNWSGVFQLVVKAHYPNYSLCLCDGLYIDGQDLVLHLQDEVSLDDVKRLPDDHCCIGKREFRTTSSLLSCTDNSPSRFAKLIEGLSKHKEVNWHAELPILAAFKTAAARFITTTQAGCN